ncbi:MAG: hypothetical protein ABEH59_07060 [Halobacteriales archaeon]
MDQRRFFPRFQHDALLIGEPEPHIRDPEDAPFAGPFGNGVAGRFGAGVLRGVIEEFQQHHLRSRGADGPWGI